VVRKEVEVVAIVGEGENAETAEKEADVGTETDNDGDGDGDGDAQGSEREVANSKLGNEGSSADPTKTAVAVAAVEEEAASSMQTKRLGVCSCSPVAHTQEGAARKGMVGEDH